jgi:hypothetical protein
MTLCDILTRYLGSGTHARTERSRAVTETGEAAQIFHFAVRGVPVVKTQLHVIPRVTGRKSPGLALKRARAGRCNHDATARTAAAILHSAATLMNQTSTQGPAIASSSA